MPSINRAFLEQLKDDYRQYPTFIETGTYLGETIFAVEPLFERLYTIELSDLHYTATKARYTGNKIQFIHGDSSVKLREVLGEINGPSVLFLDGHYSSGNTAQGDKDCPLVEEITNIRDIYKHAAIIIVDDVRLFAKGPTHGMSEDWSDITADKLTDILRDRITDLYYLDSECAKGDRMIIHIKSEYQPA